MRKWEKDIEVCIQRFFEAEKAALNWMKHGGGNMEIFTVLNLKGDTTINLQPHPFEKSFIYEKVKGKNVVTEKPFTKAEKQAWTNCFGKPFVVPKNLNTDITLREFLDQMIAKREFMRETLAFTKQSRFRNYIPSKRGKKP